MPTWIPSRSIAITGQVPQAMIGKGAFQETDIFGVTLPIVKHSYLITDINDIPRIVKEAFYIAQTGRPGPVVIDLPKNVQQAQDAAGLARRKSTSARLQSRSKRADDLALNEIIGLIEKVRAAGALLRRRHHHAATRRGIARSSPRRRRFR